MQNEFQYNNLGPDNGHNNFKTRRYNPEIFLYLAHVTLKIRFMNGGIIE